MKGPVTVAAIVTIAVAAAGCGGSNNHSNSGNKSTTSSTTTTQAATQSTATPPATTKSTSTASTPASSVGSFASSGNCLQLAGVGEKFAQALSAATGSGHLDLNAAVSAFKGLANGAPSGIRPDLQLIAQSFGSFASALAKAHYTVGQVPNASQVATLQAAASQLNTSKIQAAETAIANWARANCHT